MKLLLFAVLLGYFPPVSACPAVVGWAVVAISVLLLNTLTDLPGHKVPHFQLICPTFVKLYVSEFVQFTDLYSVGHHLVCGTLTGPSSLLITPWAGDLCSVGHHLDCSTWAGHFSHSSPSRLGKSALLDTVWTVANRLVTPPSSPPSRLGISALLDTSLVCFKQTGHSSLLFTF